MAGRGIILALGLALHASAMAQTPPPFLPPRTQNGHPDFQGVWSSRWLTPLERESADLPLALSQEQAVALEARIRARQQRPTNLCPETANWEGPLAVVRGEIRSSLIVDPPDGKLPYGPAGKAANDAWSKDFGAPGASDPESRVRVERCISGVGWAPLQIRSSAMLHQIVQTGDHVVLHTEAYSDLRIIPLDRAPPVREVLTPTSESVARWEGDTLVVETTRLDAKNAVRGLVIVMSADAKVTEWFTLLSPDQLLYRYTVDDPAFYSRPWTVEYVMLRSSERIYEFACHEGNYSLANILSGARRMEQPTAAKAVKN
jgi:hypothetical protein